MQNYDVFGSMKGGNARLYPNSEEQKDKRRAALAGKEWATEQHVPDFSGFIKIDHEILQKLQQALSEHGAAFRWNIDASKQANDAGGFKQLNIKSWIPKPSVQRQDSQQNFQNQQNFQSQNAMLAPTSNTAMSSNTNSRNNEQAHEKQMFNDSIPF